MRTVLFIVAGGVLLAACLGIAMFFGGGSASATLWATAVFIVLWFVAAATNMWFGVSRAGYSAREEFPIFLLIFGLPALVAIVAKWKFI